MNFPNPDNISFPFTWDCGCVQSQNNGIIDQPCESCQQESLEEDPIDALLREQQP
jgi:hypothetical protein